MDNGLLTKQLVNKFFLMMKDHVVGHGTTTSMLGSPECCRIAKLQEEKVKEKAKAKVDAKELVRHTVVKKKHKILFGGQKKMVFGGPGVQKARKALRKVRTTFLKVILEPIIKKRVQMMNITRTKGRGKDQKRKGK